MYSRRALVALGAILILARPAPPASSDPLAAAGLQPSTGRPNVLFIMSDDRKLRFEVGYGLESIVPDATASRIINEVIVPRIQRGDRDGAVISGMDAAMTVIGGGGLPAGPATPAEGERGEGRPLTLARLIVYGIIGLIVLSFLATHPTLALYLLASMLSGGGGRRRDGWGGGGGFGGVGGGGGFGGGGGRSGGGGASGSW